MTRSTNFSLPAAGAALGAGAGLGWEAAAETLGPATERGGVAGELAAAPGTLTPEAGDTPEALGAELLPGFVASPAACLHRSDSESLCSLRQATIRPPPGCTPAHSFCASSAQAARIAASVGGALASADCFAAAAQKTSSTLKLLIANLASNYRSKHRVQDKPNCKILYQAKSLFSAPRSRTNRRQRPRIMFLSGRGSYSAVFWHFGWWRVFALTQIGGFCGG